MTNRFLLAAIILVPLAACGSNDASPAPAELAKPKPASFPAGQWEVTTLTEKVKAADRFAPATSHKAGTSVVSKVCSPPGPAPSPALFIDKGDTCTATSDYASRGRINMAYNCQRLGQGLLTMNLDGDFDSDSFDVAVATGTYFSGQGDYVLTQRIKGKRLGDCPAGAAAAG